MVELMWLLDFLLAFRSNNFHESDTSLITHENRDPLRLHDLGMMPDRKRDRIRLVIVKQTTCEA